MKKLKVLLVGLLTIIMSLFCLTGCFEKGKYEAVSYTSGPVTLDVSSEDASYVELKSDDVAVVSINLDVMKLEGEGTWTKGEDGEVIIKIGVAEYTATIDGKTMVLDMEIVKITLEK